MLYKIKQRVRCPCNFYTLEGIKSSDKEEQFIEMTAIIGFSSWCIYMMVAQNMLRVYDGKLGLPEKKIIFVTAFDINKCLTRIK